MSERNWTPGPWVVEFNKQTWSWAEVIAGNFRIGWPTRATDLTNSDRVEREANAHLIAAAPGLYEALEEIMNARWTPAGISEVDADRARAALAAARGEA